MAGYSAGSTDPSAEDSARETAGVTTRAIVRYVRKHAGDGGVDRMLRRSGDGRSVAELEDEATWSSYEQKLALFEAAAEVLDDPAIGFHVGASLLDSQVAAGVRVLLRALGSPATVLRNVARVSPKFSTVCTTEAVEIHRRSAVVAYWVHDGYRPHPMDCDYTRGILTQAPALFGLPPASVVHEECQVRGAERCVYRLRWGRHHRLLTGTKGRVADLETQLAMERDHARALSATAMDLVSPDELDEVLARIVSRASSVMQAQHFLLVLDDALGSVPALHHDGIPAGQLDAVVADVMQTPLHVATGSKIVVAVASARRSYGRLAALYPPGAEFFAAERPRLATYARQAAAALDMATALDEARQKENTAQALLGLARALAGVSTVDEVAAQLARAVCSIVGGTRSSVLLWDRRVQRLRLAAHHGYEQSVAEAIEKFEVSHEDTPELARFLLTREPLHLHRATEDDEFVRSVMEAQGVDESVVVPIMADGEVEGVVSVSAAIGDRLASDGDDLADRLRGLADQAATALGRARLLEQERATVRRLQRDEEHIRRLAFLDGLTGLPNGRRFDEVLAAAIEEHRSAGARLAIAFLDLDRFKTVNDSLGHVVGNELLRVSAARLGGALRSDDVLARLGGDEFVALLPGVEDEATAERAATRLLSVFDEPFTIGDHQIFSSASIGIALFPEHGADAETLLKHADVAMYQVKDHGRRGYALYRPELSRIAERRLTLESRLHGAIDRGELEVHYQPLVGRDRRVTGAEALVRWNVPGLGLLTPADFLGLAEETGQVSALDHFVLLEACREAARWRERGRSGLRVAVNVSARHLQDAAVARSVASALEETGLPASALELEISERVAAHPTRILDQNVHELAELGIGLAIDDFGSEYAVWNHLKRFPAQRLKIDRAFIRGLPDDRFDAAIVSAVIRMAADVGIGVTAEGVETDAQAAFLIDRGCDELQGYFCSPPVPAAVLRPLLGFDDDEPAADRGTVAAHR